MPTGISCTASTGRGLTAPPASNSHRWSCWRSLRRSCPCRVPTWCATAAVWRRTASSGRRSFRHRASRVSTAMHRRREPRIGTGRGCWAVSLLWIWRPVFRHCVGGGTPALRPSVVPPWLPAHHCRHHPGGGDHPHPAPPPAGLRATSHCPGPLSPRDSRVRRSPRQRGPIGDVRAAAAYFAPSRCAMPFEIVPPSFSRRAAPRPSNRETPGPSASRILSRLSRLRIAAPRLAARRAAAAAACWGSRQRCAQAAAAGAGGPEASGGSGGVKCYALIGFRVLCPNVVRES